MEQWEVELAHAILEGDVVRGFRVVSGIGPQR